MGGSRLDHRRLYEYCDDVPPAEPEASYYAQSSTQQKLELPNQ